MSQTSCCIADYCGAPFDTTVKESRPLDTLRAFWSLYCPKHRARPATQEIITGENSCQ